MPLSSQPAWRLVLIAGSLLLALSACGRRGPLEPPPVAAAPATAQAAAPAAVDTDGDGVAEPVSPEFATPVPRTKAQRQRGYTIPKEPFVLDPLL